MFVDQFEETSRRFYGFNPAFVRQVWQKRREEERARNREQERDRINERRRRRREAQRQHRKAEAEEKARLEQLARPDEIPIPRVSVREIIQGVCDQTGLTPADILGEGRGKYTIAARHEAIRRVLVLRRDLSTPAIGRLFKRDHSTILHVARKMGVKR